MYKKEKYTLEEEIRYGLAEAITETAAIKKRLISLWKAFSDCVLIKDENERTQLKSFKENR